jgi:hypothetical protein
MPQPITEAVKGGESIINNESAELIVNLRTKREVRKTCREAA